MTTGDHAEYALLQALTDYLDSLETRVRARPDNDLDGPLLKAIECQRRRYADQMRFLQQGKR